MERGWSVHINSLYGIPSSEDVYKTEEDIFMDVTIEFITGFT